MSRSKEPSAHRMSLGVMIAAVVASPALAQGGPAGEETAVTIYSSAQPGAIPPELYRPVAGRPTLNGMAVPGYALVRHERSVRVGAGRSTLRFSDVAGLIDPTTVTFSSLTDPATRVLEQNFQFDLVSSQKLLLKYLDRPVTVERTQGGQTSTLSGTLLSAGDGLVLRGADGTVTSLRDYSSVRFPQLPGGLITQPTLEWLLNSPKGGEQRARVTYQTAGITWWADYNLVFAPGKDANSGLLDLSAWVSIINQSGATYADARLKLIAGDVNRVETPPLIMRRQQAEMVASPMMDAAGFEQKAFFEFHLYTLGRRATLPDNSTKQIELFDQARQVPARKVLVFDAASLGYAADAPLTERSYGGGGNPKVDVFLEFRNDRQFGLGVPLPAGRIRVSQLDSADGSLEFIGEDRIDHTPKDERLRIKLGSAFDVVGERRQVDFSIDTRARWMEEEIEVKLRNRKEEPVEVLVREALYRWNNWKITSRTQEFTREDSRTVVFPVRLARDGEAVIRYRVRYTW
jgi:hypothetical protein